MRRKAIEWLINNKIEIIAGLFTVAVLLLSYSFKLGSLIRGDTFRESIIELQINGLTDLLHNPVYGPIKFAELLMVKFDQPNATLLRLVSAVTVLLSIGIFYFVIRKWHTPRVAFFSTLLFGLSSYSLHLGRYSLQDAMLYLVFPSLILFGTWLKSKRNVNKIVYILPLSGVLLYIPGFIWFCAALGFIFKTRLLMAVKYMRQRNLYLSAALSGLILLPLLIAFIKTPGAVLEILAIDRLTNGNFAEIGQALIHLFSDLFLTGPELPYRWLSGTPILDFGTIALLILGLYSFARGDHTLRIRLLGVFFAISVTIIGLSENITIALLMPLLYIFVATGIAFLIQSWLIVFPKNPAARNFGLVMVGILTALICTYHVNRYFIAWPSSPQTQNSLVQSKE